MSHSRPLPMPTHAQLQILHAVIGLIAVLMVDSLIVVELSAEMLR